MGHDLKPILITGAKGYLGEHVLAALGDAAQGIDHADCDLCDADAVAGLVPDWAERTVVHLAAQVPKSAEDYGDEGAAGANKRMVESLLTQRPKHLIFASSMTVYVAEEAMPVREEAAGAPAQGYAGSKRQSELRLLEAKQTLVTVLRFPGLFGAPRLGGLLWNVAVALARGDVPQLPEQPPLWAAMHVQDAARACVAAALRTPDQSRVMNVGYPGRFSTTLAVNALAEIFERPALTKAEAPEFEMDLTLMTTYLGLPQGSFDARLRDLAEEAKRRA